jgi:hypothetical protein
MGEGVSESGCNGCYEKETLSLSRRRERERKVRISSHDVDNY